MRNGLLCSRTSGFALFIAAGLAAPLAGCSSSGSTRDNDTSPQARPTAAEPQITQVNRGRLERDYPAPISHTQAPAAGEPATDGWQITRQASGVEAPVPAAPVQENLANVTSGPNMAARLYGDLLETDIPAGGGFVGQHTVNIRQISFTNDGSDFDPQISRDGSKLVFASTQHTPTADVYIKDVGSRVLTRLTDDPAQDVMPAISPDGTRIAFASNRAGNWDIWVMPVDGGKAIQVTSDGSHDLHPSWNPEGTHVVYCKLGQTSGRWELWVADVYDNASTQFIGYGLFPEWEPVGASGLAGADRILFQRSRERGDRTFAVWTIDFNTQTLQAGRETQIASDPDHALINPSWSPTGDRVAYAAVPNPDKWIGDGVGSLPPSASIWMVSTDGRGEVPLTGGNSIDLMPTWSPRGQVVFVSNRSGVENLWAVDMAPAILAATGTQPGNDNGPTRADQGPAPASDGAFVTVPTDQ